MKKLVYALVLPLLIGVTLFSCTGRVPKANLTTDVDSISYAMGILYSQQVEQMFMQLNLDEKNKEDYIAAFKKGFTLDEKNKSSVAALVGRSMGFSMGTQFVSQFNRELFGNDSTQTISRTNFLAGYFGGLKNDSNMYFNQEEADLYVRASMETIKKNVIEKKYADVKKENADWLEANKSNEGVIALENGLQYKVITLGKGPKPVASDVVRVYYKGVNIKFFPFDVDAFVINSYNVACNRFWTFT
jgi:FKBP-type peptidyl-prolyl cis-trans isomerase FklB